MCTRSAQSERLGRNRHTSRSPSRKEGLPPKLAELAFLRIAQWFPPGNRLRFGGISLRLNSERMLASPTGKRSVLSRWLRDEENGVASPSFYSSIDKKRLQKRRRRRARQAAASPVPSRSPSNTISQSKKCARENPIHDLCGRLFVAVNLNTASAMLRIGLNSMRERINGRSGGSKCCVSQLR